MKIENKDITEEELDDLLELLKRIDPEEKVFDESKKIIKKEKDRIQEKFNKNNYYKKGD